jgi:hypothetical protein
LFFPPSLSSLSLSLSLSLDERDGGEKPLRKCKHCASR